VQEPGIAFRLHRAEDKLSRFEKDPPRIEEQALNLEDDRPRLEE
jgi:hypothetical protein